MTSSRPEKISVQSDSESQNKSTSTRLINTTLVNHSMNPKAPLNQSDFLEKSFYIIEKPPLPDYFPKHAKYIGDFKKLNNQSVLGQPAFHEGYNATFNEKTYYVKLRKLDPGMIDSDKNIELECMAYWRYKLVIPQAVPEDTIPLYDYDPIQNEYFMAGLASQWIKNFETNHADPLKEEDLLIKALDYGYQRSQLIKQLEELSTIEHRPEENTLNYFYNWASSSISEIVGSGKPAADYVKSKIDSALVTFKKSEIDLNILSTLQTLLLQRLSYIPELITTLNSSYKSNPNDNVYKKKLMDYNKEKIALENTIKSIQKFISLKLNEQIDMFQYEDAYRWCINNKIDFDNKELYPNPEENINCNGFEMTVEDLRNYHTKSIVAAFLAESALCEEADLHNKQHGKRGRLDFDMSFWNFFKKFKNPNFWEYTKSVVVGTLYNFFNIPYTQDIRMTVEHVETFPNSATPRVRYWPADHVSDVTSNSVSLFKENFYRSTDVVPFRKLQFDQIAIFRSCYTCLQDILLTPEMINAANKNLAIRSNAKFRDPDDKLVKELLSSGNQFEFNMTDYNRKLLIQSPKFQLFLKERPKKIYEYLLEDFNKNKQYYWERIKNGETEFTELYHAMRIEDLKANFDKICEEAHNASLGQSNSNDNSAMLMRKV